MTLFLLLSYSILPLIMLWMLFRLSYRSDYILRRAVVGLTFFHESILVVFPIWYSVFTGYVLEKSMSVLVSPEDLLVVIFGETVFVSMFSVGMLYKMKFNSIYIQKEPDLDLIYRENAFLFILVTFGIIIYFKQLFSMVETFESLTLHAEVGVADTWYGMVGDWIAGAFHFTSLIAACIIVVNHKKYPKIFQFMSVVVLLSLVLVGLSMGYRGRITWFASFFIIVGIIKRKIIPVYISVITLLLFLPVSSYLSGEYRSVYYGELQGSSKLEALGYIMNSIKNEETGSSENEGLMANIAKRSQGPRNSVVLHQLYENGMAAGFKPLEGAFYLPIPRVIWPEKRPAGSINDTNYGAAIFLVRSIGYGAPFYNMGPVLASAHAYWEGGWIWLILVGLITGLFWNAILSWCDRYRGDLAVIVALTFSAALLIDGLLTALSPLYTLIDIFWSAILPNLIVYKLIGYVSSLISTQSKYGKLLAITGSKA